MDSQNPVASRKQHSSQQPEARSQQPEANSQQKTANLINIFDALHLFLYFCRGVYALIQKARPEPDCFL